MATEFSEFRIKISAFQNHKFLHSSGAIFPFNDGLTTGGWKGVLG